jgi:O-antigen biosynthesis protein
MHCHYPEAIVPAARREAFAHFLEGAAYIFAPSRDIKTRFEAAGVRYAIEVRPHDEEPLAAPACPRPKQPETFNIVILGAIGIHKGSRIVLGLARDAKARDLPIRYRIVGYSDAPVEMEAAGVVETGPYAEADEAFAHIVEAKPSCIFLPSIWPETYCYTLSMAFALQCPPVVFDIGAQAERVREKGFGVVLPYDLMLNIKALNNRFLEMHDLA